MDNELVINAEKEVFEMKNGCICCSESGYGLRDNFDVLSF